MKGLALLRSPSRSQAAGKNTGNLALEHDHAVARIQRPGHWFCNACRKKSTSNNGMLHFRYRCSEGCDFDLCESCFQKWEDLRRAQQEATTEVAPRPLPASLEGQLRSPPAAAEAPELWKIVSINANVRKTKSTDSDIVVIKYAGDRVRGYQVDQWVKLADDSGYLMIATGNGPLLERCSEAEVAAAVVEPTEKPPEAKLVVGSTVEVICAFESEACDRISRELNIGETGTVQTINETINEAHVLVAFVTDKPPACDKQWVSMGSLSKLKVVPPEEPDLGAAKEKEWKKDAEVEAEVETNAEDTGPVLVEINLTEDTEPIEGDRRNILDIKDEPPTKVTDAVDVVDASPRTVVGFCGWCC